MIGRDLTQRDLDSVSRQGDTEEGRNQARETPPEAFRHANRDDPSQDHQLSDNKGDEPAKRLAKSRRLSERITIFFTGVIALATVLNLGVVNGQLNVMKGTLNEMQAEQRPFIIEPTIDPFFDSKNNEFHFPMTFKNVGKTPTVGLYIGARATDGERWRENMDISCQKGFEQLNGAGFTILPNSIYFQDYVKEHVENIIPISEIKSGKIKDPHIVGCVVYGSPVDAQKHSTQFKAKVDIVGIKATVVYVHPYAAN
jgi:hypothetical protein